MTWQARWVCNRGRRRFNRRAGQNNNTTARDGPTANDPGFLERYVARFDLSNVNQTRVKLALDSSPVALLDLGFEGYWKWNDYKDNNFGFSPVIGRKYDTRQAYYVSVSWGDPNAFRVTAFGDIGFIQYDSYHRNIGNVTGTGTCVPAAPNCFNPDTPPNSTAYNWDATNNDRNWALGLGTDWKALERLTIMGSAIWSRTQGWVDLASQNNFGRQPVPDPQLRYVEQSHAQPEGHLSVQQELGVHRRVRLRDPQL